MKIRTGISLLACTALLLGATGISAQNLKQATPTSLSSVAPSAPSIVNTGMIRPNASVVTLKGMVSANNAPTLYWLACGTNPQAMNTTTPKGNPFVGSNAVSTTVTGLRPNTTYYFQFFASNASGTTVGSIQSITTGNDATGQVRAALPTANTANVSTGVGMRSVHFAQ